jgi:hypothetical protein
MENERLRASSGATIHADQATLIARDGLRSWADPSKKF